MQISSHVIFTTPEPALTKIRRSLWLSGTLVLVGEVLVWHLSGVPATSAFGVIGISLCVLFILCTYGLIGIQYWHLRQCQLIVDAQGMRLRSGLPRVWQYHEKLRGWSLDWTQLASRVIDINASMESKGLQSVDLNFDLEQGHQGRLVPAE